MFKKLILFILLVIAITLIAYSQEENYSIEVIEDSNCQWVFCALQKNDLPLAKLQYSTVCNNPSFKNKIGYTWLTFTVWHGDPEQVKWALSLPNVNVNDNFDGQTVLYKTVLNLYNNNIIEKTHPRYKILQLLLEHKADPLYKNNSSGSIYSNGESVLDLIKTLHLENTVYGSLVISYIK